MICFELCKLFWFLSLFLFAFPYLNSYMQSFLCVSPLFKFWLEHPKLEQNPKFTPLSETMSKPTPFICGALSPDSIVHFLVGMFRARGGRGGDFNWSLGRGVSLKPSKPVTLFETKLLIFYPVQDKRPYFSTLIRFVLHSELGIFLQ